ncbi:unnamed protein product [Lathyrus oleraceus]
MITPTFFDITATTGVRPTRLDFDPTKITITNHVFSFSITTYRSFIEDHREITNDIFAQEHIAFLTYWLSMYLLCARFV